MKTYMIDFENVKSNGLTGIELLNENDKVIILYSDKSDTISFDMHKKILESKSDIQYVKVRVGSKNALDFQLATLLGYLVAKNENSHIFIISNDRGFDRLHDFWNENEMNTHNCVVYRTQNIQKAVLSIEKNQEKRIENTEENSTEIIENPIEIKKVAIETTKTIDDSLDNSIKEILGDICKDEDLPQIKEALLNSVSKEDFHNGLAKVFKQQATEFYKQLRPKYIQLKELSNKENNIEIINNETITDAKSKLSDELARLLKDVCNENDLKQIENCFNTTETKQGLYISMLKIYKRERGCEIYKILKPEYSNLVTLKG